MKKFFIGLTLLVTLCFASPSMAFLGGTDIDNSGIMGDKNHHNTIINGDYNSGANAGGSNVNVNKNKNVNKNTNVNLNVNKNINKQSQAQMQGQMQGQLQGQTAHNEGVTQIVEAAETKRDHISGSAFTAAVSSYGDRYKKGAEFEEVAVLTAIKKNFSFEAAYEDYGRKYGEGKCKTIGHSYSGRHEDDPSESVEVFTLDNIKDIKRPFEVIGFLTVKAIKEGIDSFLVLQKAVLSSCLMKADAFVVTDEGAAFRPKSKGWGIGTFFTGGQVADHSGRGNATSAGGGTGFSSTSAELVTLPWMTIQVIKYTE